MRSFSVRIFFCCSPATTRSSAQSKSSCESALAPRRPAAIAASLQMFASSAPVRPDVWRATVESFMSFGERLAARVDPENRLAPGEIGRRDEHLPVEAAGTEQRRIEILNPVRGSHHDDLPGAVEAVELDEELVERLVLLAVEAVAGALRADGVELVDEDDGGRVLPRLLEELADPRRAETREHLDERRRARGVEVRARLVGNRLREQRLAGARAGRRGAAPSAPSHRAARSAPGRGGSRRPP